jgi:hypothetical protein
VHRRKGYSPEYLEGKFSELRIDAVLRSSAIIANSSPIHHPLLAWGRCAMNGAEHPRGTVLMEWWFLALTVRKW